MNQLFLFTGPSGDNFRVVPHLPTALGVGISSAGRSRVSEESVERVRQSFLRSPKKSVRHGSCELDVSTFICDMLGLDLGRNIGYPD
jgi:hypothetical protein